MNLPASNPTKAPTSTVFLTDSPTAAPQPLTNSPTAVTPVTDAPVVTASPTSAGPCSLSPVARRTQILDILDDVSDPTLLATAGTPQNSAAEWLIGSDAFTVCPGDTKLIQRYVMALFYYSTEGDSWNTCSQTDTACAIGTSYLAPVNECEWSGSACDAENCMTEIVFGKYAFLL